MRSRSIQWYLKLIVIFILSGCIFEIIKYLSQNYRAIHPDLNRDHLINRENEDLQKKSKSEKSKIYTGPGEMGVPYQLPPGLEKEKDALYRLNGFNARASDDIAFNRSLPDIRHPKCQDLMYAKDLPQASVIVPFFNEHWSTLVRTFTSVLNRSPPEYLAEIILVDDGSKKGFLKDKLTEFIKKFPKVSLVRLTKRQGLIAARLAGAKVAVGAVLIFLDSHTECNVGWLEPLLDPIAKNKKTCVCPFIDIIDYETFAYRKQDDGARGAFDWGLYYKRLPLLESDIKNMPEPFKSPVMAGGLFAISADFFWKLGGYDAGLKIWGGEQYELSFKIWQCGGMMIDAPCSHVGHIYRKFSPVFASDANEKYIGEPYLQKNHKRVAEVWMDEYADYVYRRFPLYYKINTGDLTEQRAIRERLHCKPFKWFLKEVAFDLMRHYPPVDPKDFANGYVKSVANSFVCVDSQSKGHLDRLGLRPCGEGEQNFKLTWHKDIRISHRPLCWDVSSSETQSPVLLYACHGGKGNQYWKLDQEKKMIMHGNGPRCLEANPSMMEIFVTNCDERKLTQKWIFENVESARLKLWDKEDELLGIE